MPAGPLVSPAPVSSVPVSPALASPSLARRALLLALPAVALPRAGARAAAPPEIVNGVVVGRDGWLFPVWDPMRTILPASGQKVTALIGETVRALRARGTETTIALLPPPSRIYPEGLPEGMSIAAPVQQRYATLLRDIREAGALVPDLAAALAQARRQQPATLLFLKADTHWTGEGAEAAATACATAMQQAYRLPPSATPGVTLGAPVETDQTYDLSRLLPPARRGQYPAQTYFVRPPAQSAAANALIEPEAAEIAVVGNSYMQPRYGFANVLSAALQRPVSLTWDVNQVGPYQLLLRCLGGEAFRQRRPKAIVWTFQEINYDVMPERRDIWLQDSMTAEKFLSEVKRLVG